jgi:NhaP-type Na+/H+ or K+/H+ antiporter
MKPFNLAIALFSIIIIVLGLFYKKFRRSPFNETLLSMLLGIVLSPFVFNVLRVAEWGKIDDITEKVCRLTLSMALMATAFRISQQYLSGNKKVQAVLLLLVMPAMFLASAVIIHFLTGLNWLLSLLIGAVITPTDPVLAGTIVTGEKAEELLPQRTRESLSFEAGANDGLAFPFVMLCLLLIQKPGHAWQEWITKVVLWETGGAILMGLIVGYVLGVLLQWCIRKNFTGKPAILAFALSVGFFVLSSFELLELNGILGVFITGLMLKKKLSNQKDIEETQIQEMMSRLFTIPIFVFFGLILPWEQWFALGWTAIGILTLVLLFRRLPFLFMAKPLLHGFKTKDIAFMGWFGPIGVAALFYCFYTYKKLHVEEIWTISSLVVFSSVIVHGLTAYPLLKQYGEKKNSD